MKQCDKSSKCFLDGKAVKAIEDIIKSGNDAEIRKRGDGYVILEVKKKIKAIPHKDCAQVAQSDFSSEYTD